MFQIANILAYVSFFSVLIPIFFLLRRKQNFKSFLLRVLAILLFISAASDSISYLLRQSGRPSILVVNTYFLAQFFLLSFIYHHLLKNKNIIYATVILFAIFSIINASFIQPFSQFQSWPLVLGGIIMLVYSVSYYVQTLKISPPVDPFCFYPFWINSAVFYYFAFNLFIFALSSYVFTTMTRDISLTYWGFHNFNGIMKNLLFAIGIYVGRNGLITQRYL